MSRSAFSMIELVFVIVILGIMAAVAVPKFSGIQDDALISNEKTSIGIARQGIAALYGKRLVRGKDFSITVNNEDGADYTVLVNFSANYYPISLGAESSTASGTTTNTFTGATTRGDYRALSLLIESESLGEWNRSGQAASTDTVAYSGPASNVVTDQNAEVHTGSYWEYNNANGKILLK